MGNKETLATLGTQDTRLRQKQKNTKKKHKKQHQKKPNKNKNKNKKPQTTKKNPTQHCKLNR